MKKIVLFFLQLRAIEKGFICFPASSQHFDGCHTQQQTFDLTIAEINGNDRIRAFVLYFDDRAHAEMVMREPVSDMHVRDAQAAPIVGLACLRGFGQVHRFGFRLDSSSSDLAGFSAELAGAVRTV